MAKRRYAYYTLASEDSDETNFLSYQNAFTAYQQCQCSATLYGTDDEDNISVILSK